MRVHSAKQEAIQTIERLPDDVPLDEIVYRLYVLNKVQQGVHVDAGEVSRRFMVVLPQWALGTEPE